MRAFVTGGSGFIGSHLIDALLKNGWGVRALAHNEPILQEGRVEVLKGDICDRAVLKQGLQGADILFHLASALGSSLLSRDEFFRINASGTEAVLDAAREVGVRKAIHMSSAGVLGAAAREDVAAEDYPLRPRQVYDLTKLEGERAALRFAAMGLYTVVIRPGWAYGPRDRRTLKLISAICDKKCLAMPKGNARQTPVYVTDLVRGILLAAEKGVTGTVYHLAGGEILTAGKMVEVISCSCGRRYPIFRLPLLPARLSAFALEKMFSLWQKEPPLNRPKLSFFLDSKPLSIEKARRELGFAPQVPFLQGIELALSWYREHGWIRKKS
jgi:nucleoside-diphosphate-sugar epimerase